MPGRQATIGDHRYLSEDAPYSMVCLSSLSRALGLKTPLMDSIAYLGGALMQTDYWANGRTVKDLGMENLTLDEMKDLLENGYPE
ncbi:MAG: NAD/NADP octopine/nopaline dehydrogenase family protein [Oscillospiraceae bacterium]|nr:NAD/NADP octopine/nopaline dehydrogenase family protein [Oscillospiraceae bacterium]